jgi:uncharacterized SAM-binding protein YcdF (DUF218 family)
MRFIISLASIIFAFTLLIWGVSTYLAPDDLKKCGLVPSSEPGCQKADAIVAISGGDTKARTKEAIVLYQNGWAGELVFSGAALDPRSPSNAEAMRLQAIEAGVPANSIAIETFAQNTEQNAIKTNELVEEKNTRRIILVTSGYHQRRASMEFEQAFAGSEIINSPVPSDKQWSRGWWATPNGWWLAVSEIIKILFVTSKG